MKLNKCICGGEPKLRLSVDNEWYIYCPKCKQSVMDYADKRCQSIRVIEPRRELYHLWEVRQSKLAKEISKGKE